MLRVSEHGQLQGGIGVVQGIDLQIVDDGLQAVHPVRVAMAVLSVRVGEVHMQLVHARGVVHVRHDLVPGYSSLCLDRGHGRFEHAGEHWSVLSPQVAHGPHAKVQDDAEPVQSRFLVPRLAGRGCARSRGTGGLPPLARRLGRSERGSSRRRMWVPVAVDAFCVREKDELMGAQDNLILLLHPGDDTGNPLLAGSADLLLYEFGDARARVQRRCLRH